MGGAHGPDWTPDVDSWIPETEQRLRAVVERVLKRAERTRDAELTSAVKEALWILDQLTKLKNAGYRLEAPRS